MTLNQPEHCSHSGDIVISSGDWDALCADCDTPMVWAARRDLVAAHQTIADQARVIADLRDDASALQESLDTAKTDYLAGLTSWKDRMEVLKQRQSSVWQEGFQAGKRTC